MNERVGMAQKASAQQLNLWQEKMLHLFWWYLIIWTIGKKAYFSSKVTLAAIWIPQIDLQINWIIAPTHPEMYSAICLRKDRFDTF
jgi:hypothetical protein